MATTVQKAAAPSWYNPEDTRANSGYTASQLYGFRQKYRPGQALMANGQQVIDARGNWSGNARAAHNYFTSNPYQAPATTPPVDTGSAASATPTDQGIGDATFWKTIMPDVSPGAGIPQVQDYYGKLEDDPIYQYQAQRGSKELAQRLAAQGHTDSGYADQLQNDLTAQLRSDAAARQSRVGEINSERAYQTWNQRPETLLKVLQDESDRAERTGNANWGRITDVLGMLLDQSTLGLGANAASGSANIKKSLADTLASLLASAGGGGGGGGRSSVPPSAPSANSLAPYAGASNYLNDAGLINLIGSAINKYL